MSLKKKYLAFSVLAVLLLILAAVSQKEALYVSHSPGFYDSEFQLELLSDYDYTIYYTLDGSDPDRNATLYTGPIRIDDASTHENVYANITDVTALHHRDLVEKYSPYPLIYPVPEEPIDKCTVLRAVAYSDDSAVASFTGSYFVGFQNKQGYEGMKMVSLITDPKNLFDDEIGIYVLGNTFQEYLPTLGTGVSWTETAWSWWNANYRLGGREWERPAHVEVFDTDATQELASACGIRVQGHGTRGLLPRSLGVFSRIEYSGQEHFDTDLFGSTIRPHKFTLFSGGDDNICKIRDYMIQTMTEHLDYGTMDFYPCALFLDGEYWGTYFIIEHYNSKFFEDHYDVPEYDVIMYKVDAITEGLESDEALYTEMKDYITSYDMTNPEYYAQAQKLIDMESCIDYYATQIYIGRQGDWPLKNFAVWRSRSEQYTNPYRDGRWRWLMFDSNSPGLGRQYMHTDTLEYVLSLDPFFRSLWRNDSFREQVIQRMRHLANEVFTEENCEAYFRHYQDTMLEALYASNRRFRGNDESEGIQFDIQVLRDFFRERALFLDTMIARNPPS